MHLNLVRSCETPSDPARCPLPPVWVPSRLRALARTARDSRASCAPSRGCARLVPRTSQALAGGLSLRIAGFFACTRLSCSVLYLAFVCSMLRSVARSVRLVKPLRPCAVSVSFRPHRLRLSLLCSAALVLSQALRLAADSLASCWLCCCTCSAAACSPAL